MPRRSRELCGSANTAQTPMAHTPPDNFDELVVEGAQAAGLAADLVERDYWMYQVAGCLLGHSSEYPGSITIMSGGSVLALSGIIERVSEDADFIATWPEGVLNCSSNKGKRLLDEYQGRVGQTLGLVTERLGRGGGNFFRSTRYYYQSQVLAPGARPFVLSDLGIRDIDDDLTLTLEGRPYLSRFASGQGMALPPDLEPREIVGMHPVTILADKLDAVCWRAKQVPLEGSRALNSLQARVRDHYDLFRLIGWLESQSMLTEDLVARAVDHMRRGDETIRQIRRVRRPSHPRPDAGYHTLRTWHPGTEEYEAVASVFPSLGSSVWGDLPDYAKVAQRIRECELL